VAKLASYYQGNDLRKPSGGLKGRHRKVKRKALCGGPPQVPTLANEDLRVVERVYGGNHKVRLRQAHTVNLIIPERKIAVKTTILRIVDNPANREYAKRGIITKGTVIETEHGRAVVTSRPGQDGVINAVLIGPR